MGAILFVDDEPRVLEGLENLLFEQAEVWELAFAASGEAALALMAERHFDVLVTDMRMPGMDGATLLEEVHERSPTTLCLVLSGRTEPEQAWRALPLIHDYLSKPTSPEVLVSRLARALALSRSCRSEALRRVVGRLRGLPPRPQTHLAFQRLMKAGATAEDIGAVLEQDPAVTASIFRIVNSSFFAASRPVDRVRDAIVRLGLEHTGQLVLAADAFAQAAGPAAYTEAVFSHSCAVARVAEAIAPREGRNRAFLAGTLHDIGHVVMAEHFPEIPHAVVGPNGLISELAPGVEEAALGFGHTHCGAYLMRLWNLDEAVAEAIEFHHDPSPLPAERRPLALIVHAADRAVHEAQSNATSREDDVLSRACEIVAAGGRP